MADVGDSRGLGGSGRILGEASSQQGGAALEQVTQGTQRLSILGQFKTQLDKAVADLKQCWKQSCFSWAPRGPFQSTRL